MGLGVLTTVSLPLKPPNRRVVHPPNHRLPSPLRAFIPRRFPVGPFPSRPRLPIRSTTVHHPRPEPHGFALGDLRKPPTAYPSRTLGLSLNNGSLPFNGDPMTGAAAVAMGQSIKRRDGAQSRISLAQPPPRAAHALVSSHVHEVSFHSSASPSSVSFLSFFPPFINSSLSHPLFPQSLLPGVFFFPFSPVSFLLGSVSSY